MHNKGKKQLRTWLGFLLLLCVPVLFTSCASSDAVSSEGEAPVSTTGTSAYSTSAASGTSSFSASSIPSTQITESTTTAQTTGTTITAVRPSTAPPTSAAPSTTVPTTAAPTQPPDRAEQLLKSLTVEEKVGQLFLARCPASNGAAAVSRYQPGGYVLFARDFQNQTPASVKKTIQSYQTAAKIPMLICVDEEGGKVNRVSRYSAFRSEPFLSPQQVYASGGWSGVVADTREKADLLLSLGINVNLAPVCDVPYSADDYIYPRSFSTDASAVSQYISRVVSTMKEKGIGSVLKHFPGYGGNVDTHTGVAVDNRSLSVFQERDFLPFQAGIEAGTGAILISHNILTAAQADVPSSLSPAVHRIIREQLGFNGVLITDDLSMGAIQSYAPGQSVGVAAVLAGNDLLCCTDYQTEIPAVLAAVKDGTISTARLDESVLRILRWKLELGIISW